MRAGGRAGGREGGREGGRGGRRKGKRGEKIEGYLFLVGVGDKRYRGSDERKKSMIKVKGMVSFISRVQTTLLPKTVRWESGSKKPKILHENAAVILRRSSCCHP